MTIQELRKKYYQNIDRLDFDLLLAYTLKKSREYILTYPEKNFTKAQIRKVEFFIKKKISGFSLAVLLGEKEFYGNRFIVDENVLVPRPETEFIVEDVIKNLKTRTEQMTVVDVGTGTGCIVISIAREFLRSKNLNFYGLDVSSSALKISRKNSKLNSTYEKIKFLKNDLLLGIQGSRFNIQNSLIVTANLPYLTAEQIKKSPTIKKEPRLALLAGRDGLKYYKILFKQLSDFKIKKSNLNIKLYCEIDPAQVSKIKKIAQDLFSKYTIRTLKDYRGLDRFVIVKIK